MGKGRKGKPSMSEIQTLSGNLSGKWSASPIYTYAIFYHEKFARLSEPSSVLTALFKPIFTVQLLRGGQDNYKPAAAMPQKGGAMSNNIHGTWR